MNLKQYIDNIPDFPKEGILFRDIQPILENSNLFSGCISELGGLLKYNIPTYWVGIESRGFIFASALAEKFGGGFKMIRKKGKLPNSNLVSLEYELEYGSDTIEMKSGEGDVVIVDDVFATGGTMDAAVNLCNLAGYTVIDKLCLIDIGIIKEHNVKCLIKY